MVSEQEISPTFDRTTNKNGIQLTILRTITPTTFDNCFAFVNRYSISKSLVNTLPIVVGCDNTFLILYAGGAAR